MKKLTLLLLAASLSLLAAGSHQKLKADYQDRDMDGVIDRYDRCPHTPFFALVNKKGCMIKKIKISKEKEREVRKLLSQRR
jgi:hypothetical protein